MSHHRAAVVKTVARNPAAGPLRLQTKRESACEILHSLAAVLSSCSVKPTGHFAEAKLWIFDLFVGLTLYWFLARPMCPRIGAFLGGYHEKADRGFGGWRAGAGRGHDRHN